MYSSDIKKIFAKTVLLIAAVTVLLAPQPTDAAIISLESRVSNLKEGQIIKVGVQLKENFTAINAISGSVFVPFEHFDFVTTDLEDSAVSFWIKEPEYDPATSLITFEGILLKDGGFRAASGHIFSATFRALQAGEAKFELASGEVLAHDGSATNVLSGLKGVSLTIEPREDCVGIDCVPTEVRPLLMTSAEYTDQVAGPRGLSASGVLLSWLGTLVAFIAGAIIAFIVENRRHPHTRPRNYKEAIKETRSLIGRGSSGLSKKALLYFAVPIFVAFLVSIFVTYILYLTIGSADLLFMPIIKMPVFYFLALLALHITLYLLILWAVFRSLKRKFFGGISYFWGTIFGAIIILTILFSGFDQYRFIFEDDIASLPSVNQMHLSTTQ
ncbi:MAG: hypothetical protein R3B52_00260 [Candidatus Paceibacterota bacterium]